jgi:Replication-relaxation
MPPIRPRRQLLHNEDKSVNASGDTSETAEPARRLDSVAGEVLESLYQHRLLSSSQLRVMHTPQASLRWTQRVIAELASQGLVAWVYGRGRLRIWYLTEVGAELVEALPDRVEERRKLLDAR